MNNVEMVKVLERIEDKYPVEQWTGGGIAVWPLVRINLFSKFCYLGKQGGDTAGGKRLATLVSSQLQYLKAKIFDAAHNENLNGRTADVVFLNNTGCRRQIGEYWYDVLCDPLIEQFDKAGKRTVTLEFANDVYRFPRYGKSAFIQPYLDLLKIRQKLMPRKIDWQLPLFAECNHELQVGIEGYSGFALDELQYQLAAIVSQAEYFFRQLTKLKPSLGFATIYYNNTCMAFVLACKRAGVRSVDIQHGFQGPFHPAFGPWKRFPDKGYELMPDYFWNWSKEDSAVIADWNTYKHRPYTGGNLFLSKWKDQSSDWNRHYGEMAAKLFGAKADGRAKVLYSLNYDDIPDWITDAIKRSEDKYVWWIRIHPAMLAEKLDQYKRFIAEKKIKNAVIEEPSTWPLPFLLQYCDVHVTEGSSVVLEAKEYSMASVVMDPVALKVFAEEVSTGLAKYADTTGELLAAIEEQEKRSLQMRHNYESKNDLGASGAVSSFLKFTAESS